MHLIENAADWHANMALKAYRKKDYPAFKRHIGIADDLRLLAYLRSKR